MTPFNKNIQFERVCRACMCKEQKPATNRRLSRSHHPEQLQSIFSFPTKDTSLPIVTILMTTIPNLQIEESDQLPKLICIKCLDKVLAMWQFQQMCIHSDQHMRNLLDYEAVEEKYTKPDGQIANSLVDSDPLQAGHSVDAIGTVTSMEDVQGFLKLEIEENEPMVMMHTPAPMVEILGISHLEEQEMDIKGTNSEDDGDSDNNYSDWEKEQRKGKKSEKQKTQKTSNVKHEQDTKLECTSDTSVEGATKVNATKLKKPTTNQTNVEKYKCDECPRKYIKADSLEAHKEMHAKGLVKDYDCDECGKKFMKRYSLTRHKRTHGLGRHDETGKKLDMPRPHICEYCNKGFQQSCTLKDHLRVHTGEQPFLCSECGKAFNSASNMKQHLLRHTGLKRYECPECPKKFPCLSDLASHKAVHKKYKPHICDICGSAFGKPFQLKKHKMYHNGEKPHKCEYCEMRFVCVDHMRRHQRTHTGEKPYKCKYCERAFAQSNDLIKHLRMHLGDNVYKCELCPKAYRLASELREHFATHKNDDEETRQNHFKAMIEEETRIKTSLLGGGSVKMPNNNGFCV